MKKMCADKDLAPKWQGADWGTVSNKTGDFKKIYTLLII